MAFWAVGGGEETVCCRGKGVVGLRSRELGCQGSFVPSWNWEMPCLTREWSVATPRVGCQGYWIPGLMVQAPLALSTNNGRLSGQGAGLCLHEQL